jgi:chemotaxis protein CheD
MKKHVLNIGDVKTDISPSVFTCFGLGSCIGLFVQDRAAGISGGAHILLPESIKANTDDGKHYNVKDALDKLFEQFQRYGSSLETLRAKIVGGANIISAFGNVGERNVRSIKDHLVANKIFIAAVDVGGSSSRTAHFCSRTSELKVRTSENNNYKIY